MVPDPDFAVRDASVPARRPGSVEAQVDGELVLLSPKDFSYFAAHGTGGGVWELIDGKRTVADIVRVLERQYTAEPGVIKSETLAFVDALCAAGLVEIRG